MRNFVIFCCIIFLTACSMKMTAERAYKKGKYLESINIMAKYVEEKGEKKLKPDDLASFRQLVANVMTHYENNLLTADRSDHKSRINSYIALLNMKSRLSNRFFSQQLSFFNNKYESMTLKKNIAEEYYLWGKEITCQTSSCYAMRAENFKNGLEYYNYKDIEKLYQQANTKYMQIAAKEYYDLGKQYAETDSFKLAADNFAKASQVYKPLGKYKDSDQLFTTYDKEYRTQEARAHYEQAQSILTYANTRYHYRQIAQLFNYAAEIYLPYGDYLGAATFAQQYYEMGIIRIYIDPEYRNLAAKTFTNNYYQFVNSPWQADIAININIQNYYKDTSLQPHISSMSENIIEKTIDVTNADGTTGKKDIYKTYHFNLETYNYSNEMRFSAHINVNGLFYYNDSEDFITRSDKTKYVYTGDVPAKYRNYSKGKFISRERLYDDGLEQSMDYIKEKLNNIHYNTERL